MDEQIAKQDEIFEKKRGFVRWIDYHFLWEVFSSYV